MDNTQFFIKMRYIINEMRFKYNLITDINSEYKQMRGISNQEYEIINEFNNMFCFANQENKIKLENLSNQIEEYLYINCKHKFETDVIDTNYETTLLVNYCAICGMTKKII